MRPAGRGGGSILIDWPRWVPHKYGLPWGRDGDGDVDGSASGVGDYSAADGGGGAGGSEAVGVGGAAGGDADGGDGSADDGSRIYSPPPLWKMM